MKTKRKTALVLSLLASAMLASATPVLAAGGGGAGKEPVADLAFVKFADTGTTVQPRVGPTTIRQQ